MPTKKEVSAVLNGMRVLEEKPQKMISKEDVHKREHLRRWWLKWGRLRPMNQSEDETKYSERNNSITTTVLDRDGDDTAGLDAVNEHLVGSDVPLKITGAVMNKTEQRNSIVQTIVDDFRPDKGDQKILRAIGRSATVNAAVLLTAATGGAAAAGGVGFGVGGAITAKRFADGCEHNDEKEVAKSLAVYGAATGASIAGQAVTGAVLIGLGAALPIAAAVAFGAGCASGITAGALSEWTVDGVMDKLKKEKNRDLSPERCQREGPFLSPHSCPHESYRETKLKKSMSAAVHIKFSQSSNITQRSSLKRCHSDGLIAGFHKWSRRREKLRRRHSFSL